MGGCKAARRTANIRTREVPKWSRATWKYFSDYLPICGRCVLSDKAMTCGGQLRRALGGSYSLHRKRGPRSKSKSTTLTTHSAEELDDTTDAVTTTPPPPPTHPA